MRIEPALTLDLGCGTCMSFQSIPPGSFRMGSRGDIFHEEPLHRVLITRTFFLGTFPVTQQQFAKWKLEHANYFANRPQHPAESMDWLEANQYCSWLKVICSTQIPSGYEVGLPTEAQWEYACRAGTETEYYTGDGEAALAEAGCFSGNSSSQTQRVGQLKANEFGLYDMLGNVREWCADAWDANAYKRRVNGVCDPFVDGGSDALRVIRGGGWDYSPGYCRSAYRNRWSPSNRHWVLGFRVCLSVPRSVPRQESRVSDLDDFDTARFPND